MLDLVRTETPEATVVPSRIALKVRDLLEVAEIPYEQISTYDPYNYQEDWPGIVTYHGRVFDDHNYAFVTTVTRESLFQAAEDMFYMSADEIRQHVAENKKREG
jgi:hypothetical protein